VLYILSRDGQKSAQDINTTSHGDSMSVANKYEDAITELITLCRERWHYGDGGLVSNKTGKPVGSSNPNNSYLTVQIQQNNEVTHRLRVHRVIFLLHYGYMPETVDHINGDASDNRIENLRAATLAENARNTGITSRNKLGYKGVVYEQRLGGKPYVCYIKINGKRTRQGNYATPEEAHAVYQRVAAEAFGEFARFV
jgi:HNH endonuclease